jgi:hypothetical protein
MREFAQDKRHEIEGLQNDLERYKKQFLQVQQECQKLTTLNDEFRGERMTLLR